MGCAECTALALTSPPARLGYPHRGCLCCQGAHSAAGETQGSTGHPGTVPHLRPAAGKPDWLQGRTGGTGRRSVPVQACEGVRSSRGFAM